MRFIFTFFFPPPPHPNKHKENEATKAQCRDKKAFGWPFNSQEQDFLMTAMNKSRTESV